LLESADDVTQGATKGNSGIVHAGFSILLVSYENTVSVFIILREEVHERGFLEVSMLRAQPVVGGVGAEFEHRSLVSFNRFGDVKHVTIAS